MYMYIYIYYIIYNIIYIIYIYPSCKRLLIYQLCITLRVFELCLFCTGITLRFRDKLHARVCWHLLLAVSQLWIFKGSQHVQRIFPIDSYRFFHFRWEKFQEFKTNHRLKKPMENPAFRNLQRPLSRCQRWKRIVRSEEGHLGRKNTVG